MKNKLLESLPAVAKYLFLLSLLLMPFLFQMTMVEADAETVVKVEPHASFAHVGETFTVNVTVADVQNLYGVEVTLYWNTSILEMVNANVRLGVEDNQDGVLYKPVRIIQNQTFQQRGEYILAGLTAAPEPPLPPSFNGSGNIVKITFRVIGVGSCELSIRSKLASNIMTPTGVARIEHATVDGFFGPIQIAALPKRITVGENINISGFITPAQANVSVTISHRRDEETEWHILKIVETDEQGSYLYMWTPEKSGRYYVKSTATILGAERTSSVISINVNEPEQPIWLYSGILVAIIALGITILVIYRKRTRRSRKTR